MITWPRFSDNPDVDAMFRELVLADMGPYPRPGHTPMGLQQMLALVHGWHGHRCGF